MFHGEPPKRDVSKGGVGLNKRSHPLHRERKRGPAKGSVQLRSRGMLEADICCAVYDRNWMGAWNAVFLGAASMLAGRCSPL